MSREICAYCELPNPLTREHLWPAALHSRLITANKQESSKFWLARLQKEIPNEPQMRDVCAHCNNVVLSELDAYICRFFDSTLIHIPLQDDKVMFEFNYHLLKRWLLKLSYNSARIHNSHDLHAIKAVLPYIMGQDDSMGKSIQLFLQLSYPQEVPEEDLDPETPLSVRPVIFSPTMHRLGHNFFRVDGVGQKVLRAIHLRSYTFYLAFFTLNEKRAVLDDFANIFSTHSRAVLLRASRPKIEMLCNGGGAWTSYKGSRSNRLVFDKDI